MAYDEDLANRIREQLASEEACTEKAMFGGLAFLLSGNMAVGVHSGDGLMVRVGPEAGDEAAEQPHARAAVMGSRRMKGWVFVDPEGVATEPQLREWVARGVAFARSLPPKGA
jgi:TfoX/Sxy family transcriptional regulator of competence genes